MGELNTKEAWDSFLGAAGLVLFCHALSLSLFFFWLFRTFYLLASALQASCHLSPFADLILPALTALESPSPFFGCQTAGYLAAFTARPMVVQLLPSLSPSPLTIILISLPCLSLCY